MSLSSIRYVFLHTFYAYFHFSHNIFFFSPADLESSSAVLVSRGQSVVNRSSISVSISISSRKSSSVSGSQLGSRHQWSRLRLSQSLWLLSLVSLHHQVWSCVCVESQVIVVGPPLGLSGGSGLLVVFWSFSSVVCCLSSQRPSVRPSHAYPTSEAQANSQIA